MPLAALDRAVDQGLKEAALAHPSAQRSLDVRWLRRPSDTQAQACVSVLLVSAIFVLFDVFCFY